MAESANEQFLSRYRTYESLLKKRGTDYRTVEAEKASDRMTILRQMRNYLSHKEDPGFLAVTPLALKFLEGLIEEELRRDGLVKDHLVSPAKGSVKEGMDISEAIYLLVKNRVGSRPVYDPKTKLLKGTISLEQLAKALKQYGNVPVSEEACGRYGQDFVLVNAAAGAGAVPAPKAGYVCCTRDGTISSPYLGYLPGTGEEET